MTVSNEEKKNNISKRLKSACQRVMRLRNVYARFLVGGLICCIGEFIRNLGNDVSRAGLKRRLQRLLQ